MRGLANGAVAGLAVGAAALAGMSLLAPPAGSGRIGVVTETVAAQAPGTPPLRTADRTVAAPSEPVAEAGPAAGSETTSPAPEQLAEPSVAPPAPEVVAGPETQPEPVAPAIAAAPDSEPRRSAPLAAASSQADEALGTPSNLGDQASAPAEVPAQATPAPSDAGALPEAEAEAEAEAEVAAAEPAPAASLVAEVPVEVIEPPSAPPAPDLPEPSATLPEGTEPVAPGSSAQAPLPLQPEAAPQEPGLAQALDPAPAPEEETATAEAPPLPASEPGDAGDAVPEEAPALPGRVAVGGRSLPGGGPVRVNRLGVEEESAPEVVADEPAPEPLTEDLPALRRFAADWEAPAEAKPLMSLVLLDDGATDPAAVAGLPWPVSVALDPARENAAERLAAYRASGIETLVLAALPPSAQPVDVEVFLGTALDALPETVAVLDLGQGGLGGRDATAQMAMSRVARDGRGLVLGDRGFRSGLDLAGREGVPAAEVLRDLDGEGQDGAAIRRGLDDSVRRAGQEGEAVVIGRVGPGTLAALGEWSQEGRAQEVTVAPVSAVLGSE